MAPGSWPGRLALVGAVGETFEGAFLIGTGVANTMVATGELLLFADDISFMCWNKHGSYRLSITRLS